MMEDLDPIAARADAAANEVGPSGDITSVAATCPKIALEIDVFFDGTFNNEISAIKGGTEGSYANARSNVSLLKDYYKNGPDYDVVNGGGTGICRKFYAQYVPGLGLCCRIMKVSVSISGTSGGVR